MADAAAVTTKRLRVRAGRAIKHALSTSGLRTTLKLEDWTVTHHSPECLRTARQRHTGLCLSAEAKAELLHCALNSEGPGLHTAIYVTGRGHVTLDHCVLEGMHIAVAQTDGLARAAQCQSGAPNHPPSDSVYTASTLYRISANMQPGWQGIGMHLPKIKQVCVHWCFRHDGSSERDDVEHRVSHGVHHSLQTSLCAMVSSLH